MPGGRASLPGASLARIVTAFLHRRSATPDPRFLEWKVRLFTIGAVLALAGMYLELDWMVGSAIAFLFAGFALRFVPRPDEDDGSDGEEPDG